MAWKIHYSVSDVKGQPFIVSSLLMSQYTFPYLVIWCIGNLEMTELCFTDRSLQTHHTVIKDWASLKISIKNKQVSRTKIIKRGILSYIPVRIYLILNLYRHTAYVV